MEWNTEDTRTSSSSSTVTQIDLYSLISYMYINSFNSNIRDADKVAMISEKCCHLYEHDYEIAKIDNQNGSLCGHYPPSIFVPVLEKHVTSLSHSVSGPGLGPVTIEKLEQLFVRAKNARVRGRFVVPILLCNGKFLCRSGTISAWAETYSLHAFKTAQDYASRFMSSSSSSRPRGQSEAAENVADDMESASNPMEEDGDIFDKHRGSDKLLLEALGVKYIADLMVENKKYRSYIPFALSSSEKIDRADRYRSFTVLTLPYPGCEFFKVWSQDENMSMSNVFFDWTSPGVNAALNISAAAPRSAALIPWSDYRTWDLTRLTGHYLRLLLGYLMEASDGGLLVHCLSGWDRTPLFCSLLRMLLWADGLVHCSLDPREMLYLTLAYDWFLFAHQLPDRLLRKEQILKYCFHFLRCAKDERQLSMLDYYNDHVDESVWQLRSERIESVWMAFSVLYGKVEAAQTEHLAEGSGFGNLFTSFASRLRSSTNAP